MKDFFRNTWKHRAHVVMALPAFLILLFIMYVPMSGLVMAFKNFDYSKGIFGSDEIQIMVDTFHIEEPMAVFFVHE